MLRDLAALTPPLVVCGAFLAGLVFFLRRQMGAGRRPGDPGTDTDIVDDGENADTREPAPTAPHGRRQV